MKFKGDSGDANLSGRNVMPKFNNYLDYMEWRLNRRIEVITHRVNRIKKGYLSQCKKKGEAPGEADRIWLDQFAVGNGLDIACGDFLIGDGDSAQGVDGHERMIGTDYWSEGDELAFSESGKLDFVVTNYLDGFANPIKALNEWYRVLKPNGILAIVTRDVDYYDINKTPKGPLDNMRRLSAWTNKTLPIYMARCGFVNIGCERNKQEGSLRAHGNKK